MFSQLVLNKKTSLEKESTQFLKQSLQWGYLGAFPCFKCRQCQKSETHSYQRLFKLKRTFIHFWTSWAHTLHSPSYSFMTLSSIFIKFYSPSPLLLQSPLFCFFFVMLRSHRYNRVKSPWSWNVPTSTFKLDSISTAGSDRRVCVQLSQVTGLWRRGGCSEPGWGWEMNEKSLLR